MMLQYDVAINVWDLYFHFRIMDQLDLNSWLLLNFANWLGVQRIESSNINGYPRPLTATTPYRIALQSLVRHHFPDG